MAWGKAVPAWHAALLPALLPAAAADGAAVTSATRLQVSVGVGVGVSVRVRVRIGW